MKGRYALEVYEPGSYKDVWVSFESDQPFMAIAEGDLIDPGTWPNSQSPMRRCVVTKVEHIIWETDGVAKHKVEIYTKDVAVEDAYLSITEG